MNILQPRLSLSVLLSSVLNAGLHAEEIDLPTVISAAPANSEVVFRYGIVGVRTVTLNFTRLACSGECIGGPDDFDFRFYLSDFESAAGFLLTDRSSEPSALGEISFRTGTFSSEITVAEGPDQLRQAAPGFPAIGEPFDVTVDVAASNISTLERTQSVNFAPVEFIVIGDNDSGEKIQLNSISVISSDTDSDGITDAKELEIGTDPNTPNSNQDFATAFWQVVGSSIKKVAVMPVGLLTGFGALIALIALRRRP